MTKTYYIETFGCQMNKSDSELIALSLERSGFTKSNSDTEADILIFNACSVRQHAEDRVTARISSVKNKLKKNSIIVLAGCMAQRTGKELLDQKLVNLVIGTYESPDTGSIIKKYFSDRKENEHLSLSEDDFNTRIDFDLVKNKELTPWHKWVTITHGCENFCSYCIVPYVRGKLISFPSEKIIEYIKRLASEGISEITLLGQNVNQYGGNDEIGFHQLLEQVANINGIGKINFLTSHPKDFDENIIKVIANHENISKAIHLPVQSASDNILAAMNRKYDMKHYYNIIEKIDKTLKEYSISTDIIVGFPGETKKDYDLTIDAVKKIRFDDAFTYAYSPRSGTAAYNISETISPEEKNERLEKLITLQKQISREKLQARFNTEEVVIIERISKRSPDEIMGKTSLNHPVITKGSIDDIGKRIKIKITGLKGNTLLGSRI